VQRYIDFLVVRFYRANRDLGLIFKVWEFLERNRNVRLHYTPTYSSWLNQVEIWFSKIQRDVIARGIFVSVKDLDRKLIRYIRSYNKKAKPFKWTYAETERRIRTTKKSM